MLFRSQNFWVQLVRYLFSGVIAFVVDKLLFLLTHYTLGLNIYASTTIGFCVGLVITYTLSISWSFTEHRIKERTVEILIFALIGLVGLGFMNLFVWFFTTVLLFSNALFANLCATVLVTLWNFIAKKYILFSKPKA